MREGPVARVAMVAAVEKTYSYAVPDDLADQVEPGRRVLVPFGRNRKPQPAFVLAVGHEPWTSTLRPVAEVIDNAPLLSPVLLDLGEWIARYYSCPLGRSLAAMVPEAIRKQAGFVTKRTLRTAAGVSIEDARSQQRRKVLEALETAPEGIELESLVARSGASKGVINGLVKAGMLVQSSRREPAPAPDFDRPGVEPTFALNPSQRGAIERITALADERGFRTVLLFGVSGSGKTEVYVRSIRGVLAHGRQAILLVPEIALTTQMVDRLTSRFENVAVIHSGLTGVQRSLTWSAIACGEKRVVIGTRSAVFAPCPDLGLVIVDEEQESSYKNQQAPRFHTRDVAIKRAQLASIPIVLGSATPSLETWHNCERLGHFEKIVLPGRIADLPMPRVRFVDMTIEQKQRKGLHLLSREMEESLGETLSAGRQAVLLLNRRGYASYLVCGRCRTSVVCPNCQANMVFHQTTGRAMCHHCNAKMVLPKRCSDPACGGQLTRFGMGTQRVEEEMQRKFPHAKVARADSDSMTRTSDYERIISDFSAGRLDVLVGTQMIAKGLDFPDVSFVGIVNADTSMAAPDFRGAERTFQLVTQMAGRAGRSSAGGTVVVQSLAGLTPALRFAADHDFESFAAHELEIRHRLHWPPFSRLARVVIAHPHQSEARQIARNLVEAVRTHLREVGLTSDVLGPQSAPIPRMRNTYRFDFMIRAPNAGRLLAAMERLRHDGVLGPMTKHTTIDVDPASVL